VTRARPPRTGRHFGAEHEDDRDDVEPQQQHDNSGHATVGLVEVREVVQVQHETDLRRLEHGPRQHRSPRHLHVGHVLVDVGEQANAQHEGSRVHKQAPEQLEGRRFGEQIGAADDATDGAELGREYEDGADAESDAELAELLFEEMGRIRDPHARFTIRCTAPRTARPEQKSPTSETILMAPLARTTPETLSFRNAERPGTCSARKLTSRDCASSEPTKKLATAMEPSTNRNSEKTA